MIVMMLHYYSGILLSPGGRPSLHGNGTDDLIGVGVAAVVFVIVFILFSRGGEKEDEAVDRVSEAVQPADASRDPDHPPQQ